MQQPSKNSEHRSGNGDQAEVIAFLSDPASYTPQPERVERFETHGALVFLAGDDAWKIKRAVRFPYMDFSTLDRRRAVCTHEVEINRRLAPQIYLGCVPITRTPDGHIEFGGRGTPVEWAVRMRRFDQAALLSRMAQAGALSAEQARDLADVVYESHRTAPPAAGVKGATRLERLVASVLANLTDLHGVLDAGPLQELSERLTAAMHGAAGVLDERAAAGFVRRCHGDLHLNNIVIWHGRPVLFDAIEFDDELATIDTLYDLAFLLMDLDQRGQRAAANALLNRYLWRSGAAVDLQGLRALPLFLGLRSAIRAMVTAQRCEQEHGEAQSPDRQAARRYLEAARACLAPTAPRLIAVGGLSGTGKSTLARALAPEIGPAPGAVHLRSDLERKSIFGTGETAPLGPDGYTRRASETVYAILNEKMRLVLAAGHAGIVDAVFAKPAERAEIEAVAAGLGVPFQGLWLEAPPDVLVDRVAARSGDASDATPDVVRHQLAYRIGDLAPSWTRVDASAGAPVTLARARDAVGDRP
jgi:uncharacterized protein